MIRITFRILLFAAAIVIFSSAGFAQTDLQIRPRQLPGWDVRQREGHCQLKIWVDNRAEIQMRGDKIWVTTLQGAPSYDQGSECSQPFPYNGVGNFQVHQVAGRDPVNVVQPPSRANNFTAAISIEDRESGGDSYTFNVSWVAEGNVETAPAPFFDDVRACQEVVRQTFQSKNGRGTYIDFDTFAKRESMSEGRRGGPEQEKITGVGNAKNPSVSRDLTYYCIVDTQRNEVISGDYQYSGEGVRLNDRNLLH